MLTIFDKVQQAQNKLDKQNAQPDSEQTQKELDKDKDQSTSDHVLKGEIDSGIRGLSNQFLLPHFTMCLVGKPGSGKSTLMKRMIEDKNYYRDRFDEILVVSPSISKLDMKLKKENMTQEFSFDWIYDHVFRLNELQLKNLQQRYMSTDQDKEKSKRNRKLKEKENQVFAGHFNASVAQNTHLPQTFKHAMDNNLSMNDYVMLLNRIYKDRQPQHMQNISTMIQTDVGHDKTQAAQTMYGFLSAKPRGKTASKQTETLKERNARQKQKINMIQKFADETHKLFKSHVGSKENMYQSHKNILLLLDDVIGEINREQHSYQLAKLFLNRRHLIANATVSIIVSTQKYTMIPAKIRSNSNWMVLFRLNPVDLETARTDATSYSKKTWEQIMRYIFGEDIIEDTTRQTTIQELPEGYTVDQKDFNYLSLHINGNKNKVFKMTRELLVS